MTNIEFSEALKDIIERAENTSFLDSIVDDTESLIEEFDEEE